MTVTWNNPSLKLAQIQWLQLLGLIMLLSLANEAIKIQIYAVVSHSPIQFLAMYEFLDLPSP